MKTADGTKAVDINRIQTVTFKANIKPTESTEEFRNLLTLRLEWDDKPAKEAEVQAAALAARRCPFDSCASHASSFMISALRASHSSISAFACWFRALRKRRKFSQDSASA